jgi:hypothetical protein
MQRVPLRNTSWVTIPALEDGYRAIGRRSANNLEPFSLCLLLRGFTPP